tara:strand:+ start:114 stop:311 length:198 start_codon:yes stop_codon:yes gene_type:complete
VIELDNDTKVETALIDSGQIQLTVRNFIGLEADVLFSIDELKVGGALFGNYVTNYLFHRTGSADH